MAYEATGQVTLVRDAHQVTERFRKREVVITIDPDGKYPKPVTFEFTGDRCGQLDGVQAGQVAEIEFSLEGREWVNAEGETKYFTTLRAWEIRATGEGAPQSDAPAGGVPDDEVPF